MSIKSEAASLIATIDATHVNDGIAALETFADDFYGLEMGDMLEAVSVVLLTVGDAVRLANAIEQVAAIRQRPEPTSHQIDLGVEYLRTLFGSFRLVDSLGEGPAEAAAMTREVFEDVSPARVYAEVLTAERRNALTVPLQAMVLRPGAGGREQPARVGVTQIVHAACTQPGFATRVLPAIVVHGADGVSSIREDPDRMLTALGLDERPSEYLPSSCRSPLPTARRRRSYWGR